MTALELLERQEHIITLQAQSITELFGLLSQHITAAEADRLPCISKINEAVAIRAGMEPLEMEERHE